MRRKKDGQGPNGLAGLLNNCLLRDKRIDLLKNGFIADSSIVFDYVDMRMKTNGKRSPLMSNDAGEVVTFPVRSRWNNEYDYGSYVGYKMLDEVAGLKHITHFILTIDPSIIENLMPDWWCWGEKEFLVVCGGYLVSEFLRKLRSRKKKRGEPWNFVAWVMEFHASGVLHFHFMFYGKWVATFEEIHEIWGLCDYNGVRFAKRRHITGDVLCRYLTRYLSKDLQNVGETKEMERSAAFMWFFRRRLYNFRHHIVDENGKRSWRIGDEHMKKPMWRLYKNNSVSNGSKYESEVVDAVSDFPPSDMFLRWKALHDAASHGRLLEGEFILGGGCLFGHAGVIGKS